MLAGDLGRLGQILEHLLLVEGGRQPVVELFGLDLGLELLEVVVLVLVGGDDLLVGLVLQGGVVRLVGGQLEHSDGALELHHRDEVVAHFDPDSEGVLQLPDYQLLEAVEDLGGVVNHFVEGESVPEHEDLVVEVGDLREEFDIDIDVVCLIGLCVVDLPSLHSLDIPLDGLCQLALVLLDDPLLHLALTDLLEQLLVLPLVLVEDLNGLIIEGNLLPLLHDQLIGHVLLNRLVVLREERLDLIEVAAVGGVALLPDVAQDQRLLVLPVDEVDELQQNVELGVVHGQQLGDHLDDRQNGLLEDLGGHRLPVQRHQVVVHLPEHLQGAEVRVCLWAFQHCVLFCLVRRNLVEGLVPFREELVLVLLGEVVELHFGQSLLEVSDHLQNVLVALGESLIGELHLGGLKFIFSQSVLDDVHIDLAVRSPAVEIGHFAHLLEDVLLGQWLPLLSLLHSIDFVLALEELRELPDNILLLAYHKPLDESNDSGDWKTSLRNDQQCPLGDLLEPELLFDAGGIGRRGIGLVNLKVVEEELHALDKARSGSIPQAFLWDGQHEQILRDLQESAVDIVRVRNEAFELVRVTETWAVVQVERDTVEVDLEVVGDGSAGHTVHPDSGFCGLGVLEVDRRQPQVVHYMELRPGDQVGHCGLPYVALSHNHDACWSFDGHQNFITFRYLLVELANTLKLTCCQSSFLLHIQLLLLGLSTWYLTGLYTSNTNPQYQAKIQICLDGEFRGKKEVTQLQQIS